MKALLGRLKPAGGAQGDLTCHSTSRTHVGRVRTINEDRVLDRPEDFLWAVADGMGGHQRGDLAAASAIDLLAKIPAPVHAEQIEAALERANQEIYTQLQGTSGTTLVLLSIVGVRATLRWVGDSRAYLIRNDRLQLLTHDHSLVQELVEAGLIDQDQAARHPQANVITRALGIGPEARLEALTLELQPGDRLLLCSDGLSRTLDERDVRGQPPLAVQADRLLTNSLQRDGSDNTSLVLVELA